MKRKSFGSLHLQMLVLVCLATSIISCTSTKKMNYVNNLPDSAYIKLPPVVEEERLIQKGDVLDISFSAKDADAVSPFNKVASSTAMTPAPAAKGAVAPPAQGYTVDLLGAIEMPVIGKLEVRGMTSRQLKTRLTTMVSPYLKDPIVDVKFASFNVTILGDVRAPGTFNLANRTTIFEALAAAGDMPNTAKKGNVKLYRDYAGERAVIRIDLNDKSLLYNQQAFQMKPNDVLYVQTRKSSIFREDFGLFASIVTLVVSVVTLGFAITK